MSLNIIENIVTKECQRIMGNMPGDPRYMVYTDKFDKLHEAVANLLTKRQLYLALVYLQKASKL